MVRNWIKDGLAVAKRGSAEIATEMRQAIESGQYKRLERLPASRDLAASLGVARNTLRDALYQRPAENLRAWRAMLTWCQGANRSTDAILDAMRLRDETTLKRMSTT